MLQFGTRTYDDEHDNAMNPGERLPVTASFSASLQNNHHHYPNFLRTSHIKTNRALKMRKLLAILLLTATACFYRVSNHSPVMAGTSATEFAQVALVERNYDKAFSMLHPDFQAYTTKEKFSQVLTVINTPTAPKLINATDYEPMQGEEMNIYLRGETDTETFYYRIPMKGSQDKGYKPVGIFRNQEPYRKSDLMRPFS